MRHSSISVVNTLLLLLLAFCSNWGCSWQNTVHGVAQTPAYMRLDDRIWVENPPRWRLPETAQVSIADDGVTPQAWLNAARAGVASVFQPQLPLNSAFPDAVYSLHVQWPEAPEPSNAGVTKSYRAGLFGVLEAPHMPATQSLVVTVADIDGRFVTRLNLHITPELWGPTWQDMTMLQNSFTHLASVLRGG